MRHLGFSRRLAVGLACSAVVFTACSSGASKTTTASSTTTTASTSVAPTTSTTHPASTSTSTATTTTPACPNSGSTATVKTPVSQVSALLTKITVTTSGCKDRVGFGYEVRGVAPPSCTVEYATGPFVQDASGAPVAVAGTAFVVVRCFPAYTFDFETSRTTYTGTKRIDPTGTRHVREIVETGDNEGVLTWVIGLDVQRGFAVAATGTPAKQLTITFS